MRFYRKKSGAVIGGVCNGLADTFATDPLMIRMITLILFFVSAGTVALIYCVLWIVLPEVEDLRK